MSAQRSASKNDGGQNGSQNNKNQGGRRQWRPRNINSRNNQSNSRNNNQPAKVTSREMKFHMHGTDANEKAETFGKIKEDIISRIKRTFKDPLDVASSLKDGKEKTFKEPELGQSDKAGDAKAHKERMLQLKYQIN